MATAADDHIDRLTQLAAARSGFESVWQQVAKVAAPDASDFAASSTSLGSGYGRMPQTPVASQRSKHIYDVTALNAVDRLASIIEAITMPQNEYWHGLDVIDLATLVRKRPDSEKVWLENQRNLMFTLRYDADSGFVPAMQIALRRVVAFGNSFVWVDENLDDNTSMLRYQYMPLRECYVATDKNDVVNTWYRYYEMTAAQAVERFGDRLTPSIVQAAQSPIDKDRKFTFVHCLHPSSDYNEGKSPFKYKSVHIDYDNKRIVGIRGFYEMPLIDFRWLPEPGRVYGEGPVMRVLAEIQSAQLLAKNELMASEQAVRPPLLVANAGVINRPNLNPGAVNLGGMSPTGQELIKPMFTGQRLDFATMILEAKKNAIRDSLYLNLFQILVQNPQMSATEALIRANEKAELIGPAGSRIQGGLSRMIDRELGILRRRGLYDSDSAYAPPPGVRGKVTVQFTSPIDRLRRAKEGEGISRMLEMAAPLAQVDPTVLDNFDGDIVFRELRDILGAPVGVLRDPKKVEEIRRARAEQQTAMANAQIANEMAAASKQGSEALAGMKEAGAL